MKHRYRPNLGTRAGFSLVEMLTVIAVIGVIAAIAIPNIGSINKTAEEARDRRNAQNIVSTFQVGSAAGVNWRGRSRNAKINSVIRGAAPPDGAFAGKSFRVPAMANADRRQCHKYIGIDERGDLFYDMHGGQPGPD